MAITVTEAAQRTGKSRAAILKAIKAGKVSASKDVNGNWQVEPVDVFQLYPPVSASTADGQREDQSAHSTELRLLRDQLRDRDETIRDLRARLDASEDERRKLQHLITDAQHPRPWWARILGR